MDILRIPSNSFYKKSIATISYIVLVVLINSFFILLPDISLGHSHFNFGECVVGMIYIVRDFAQREIGHYVILAMLFAAYLSYTLADHSIALASLGAFVVGESLEWTLFTLTKKPFSQRLLLSALLSVPIDSIVFLAILDRLTLTELSILTGGKVVGIVCLWGIWRYKDATCKSASVVIT